MGLPLILAPIISMLADKGLDLAAKAIDGGADKAVELIKDKTGIDLNTTKKLDPEQVTKLQQLEKTHAKDLAELALRKLQEQNRHTEALHDDEVEDRKRASEMFKHSSTLQSETAKEILKQTKIQIPLYIVLNVALVIVAKKYLLDPTIVVAAGNLLGIGLTKAYEERSKITSFLFGAEIKKTLNKKD